MRSVVPELPEVLETLEKEQGELEAKLADPELYRSEPGEIKQLTRQLKLLQGEIAEKYDRWAELEDRRLSSDSSA